MNNRKIIYEPGHISSDEIKSRQDFGAVISNLKKPPSPYWKLTGFWGAIGTSIIALLLYNNYFLKSEKENNAYDNKITLTTNSTNNNLPSDTECLNPISEENDIEFETFSVIPSQGLKIVLDDGTKINVPKGAFVTKTDEPIEISVRLFKTKTDAFLAGVPMDYEDKAFESAGMIELRGTQNGKTVEIKPEKSIQVSLALYKDPTTFNFYKLDDKTGRWSNYEANFDGDFNQENVEAKISSLEQKIMQTNTQIKELKVEKIAIKSPVKNDYHLPSLSNRVFSLHYDSYEFPELKELGSVNFEALPNQSNYQKVVQNVWSKFELESINENDYRVIFSNRRGDKETLIVRPVLKEGEADFDKSLAKYNKEVEASTVEKENLQIEVEKLEAKNQERISRIDNLKSLIAEKHKVQNNNSVKKEKAQVDIHNEIVEASANFKTNSWGVFNADKPVKYPSAVDSKVNFILAGNSFQASEIYVFDLKKDVRYNYGKGRHNLEELGMNNNETVFIVIDSDNRMGYFKANDKSDFIKQNNRELTIIKPSQINVNYFKALLDENRVRA
ncbi:MAG: hypothetical protein WED10_08040 [Brumimicrobium sp.]